MSLRLHPDLQAEVQAWANGFPRIPGAKRVIDVSVDGEVAFLEMDEVTGRSLSSRIYHLGPLTQLAIPTWVTVYGADDGARDVPESLWCRESDALALIGAFTVEARKELVRRQGELPF